VLQGKLEKWRWKRRLAATWRSRGGENVEGDTFSFYCVEKKISLILVAFFFFFLFFLI
jgi:hypothetical protein